MSCSVKKNTKAFLCNNRAQLISEICGIKAISEHKKSHAPVLNHSHKKRKDACDYVQTEKENPYTLTTLSNF